MIFFFGVKDQKDKQCRFIFTAALLIFIKGANISGGHCICNYAFVMMKVQLQVKL